MRVSSASPLSRIETSRKAVLRRSQHRGGPDLGLSAAHDSGQPGAGREILCTVVGVQHHDPSRRPGGQTISTSNLAARGLPTVAYSLALLPAGVAALATFIPRPAVADAVWTRMSGTTPDRPPGRLPLARHALLSVLLGVVAWVLLGLLALLIARGALYGLVDDGPYDNAWGGPTLAGAWLTHLGIALVIGVAAALLLAGVVRLHRTITSRLHGEQVSRWATPLAVVLSIVAGVFVVAWTSQL